MMDHKDSDLFRYFKNLLVKGFMALKKHVEEITNIVRIVMEESGLPCFTNHFSFEEFEAKFKVNLTDKDVILFNFEGNGVEEELADNIRSTIVCGEHIKQKYNEKHL